MCGGRQLRSHRRGRLLQPQRAGLWKRKWLPRWLLEPGVPWLCPSCSDHRVYEQLRWLHRLLPGLALFVDARLSQLRPLESWRGRRQLRHLRCRQLQRRGRIQLLRVHVLCGLCLDGNKCDQLRGQCGQLRPLSCRLYLLWRRRRRWSLLLLARLRVDGDRKLYLHGHAGHVRTLLSGECVRRRQRAARQRLAVDGGVAVRFRRGNSRADGVCERGRRIFTVNDAAASLRARIVRNCRS